MYSFFKPLMKVVSVILCISLVLGCAGAFAAGKTPNKVTDNAPPELTNFVFTENGATLQAGAVIHVSVQAEDRSKIRSVRIDFVNDNAESGDDNFNFSLKYNAASDRYEGEYTLDSGLANGEWRVGSVESYDEYYNTYGEIWQEKCDSSNHVCGAKSPQTSAPYMFPRSEKFLIFFVKKA